MDTIDLKFQLRLKVMVEFLGCQVTVGVDNSLNQIILKKPDSNEVPKNFTFDYVYGIESTQQQVYDDCAFSLVESVLEGYNGKPR